MVKRSSTPLKAVIIAVAAGTAGRASAQQAPPPWQLFGSDTLFDIMTQSISNAQTKGVPGANNLIYDGWGSGNAENEMKSNVQSIGPMSRNFRPGTVTSHPNWAPSVQNVLGLDAAVVITKNTTARCKNIQLPLLSSDTTKASPNNSTLPTVFGDSSAFNNTTSTKNYNQIIMVILAGVDGSGSAAACSDPRRIQAVQDFAACQGIAAIEHIYRRDDNSGTTDTFKDKIILTPDATYGYIGGRFCNGDSHGGINGATHVPGRCSVTRTTSCTSNAGCPTGEKCLYNLNNQDFDPIRRSCVAADATKWPTSCTDMTTGLPCRAGDGNPNCTQGLVVAISDTDPGSTDETTSIANRIKNDGLGATIGYAGREAVRQTGAPTAGVFMNTNSFSDAIIRLDQYLLSRRLFLQYGNDIADTGIGLVSGGGASQVAAELTLFNYMTDPNGSASPDGAPGRCNTDPVVRQFGFISCLDDCTQDVSLQGPNNLCSKAPIATVPAPLGSCLPSGAGASWTSNGAVSCNPGQICCSTGAACPTSGVCPAASGRSINSACSTNSDCASGLTCQDFLGFGTKTCG